VALATEVYGFGRVGSCVWRMSSVHAAASSSWRRSTDQTSSTQPCVDQEDWINCCTSTCLRLSNALAAEIIRKLLAGSRTRSRVPLLSPEVGGDVAMLVRGPKADGYSGADLAALVREAGVRALRRALGTTLEEMDSRLGPSCGGGAGAAAAAVDADADAGERKDKDAERAAVVLFEDFQAALGKVAPSVSKTQRRRYEALRETFASGIGGREGKERVV